MCCHEKCIDNLRTSCHSNRCQPLGTDFIRSSQTIPNGIRYSSTKLGLDVVGSACSKYF
jgi:hypothetical protein